MSSEIPILPSLTDCVIGETPVYSFTFLLLLFQSHDARAHGAKEVVEGVADEQIAACSRGVALHLPFLD